MNNWKQAKEEIRAVARLDSPDPRAVPWATMHTCVEALDKQIPQKPRETSAYPHRLYCPECFFTLAFNKENLDFIKSNQMYNYCPACGQALDWGEEAKT